MKKININLEAQYMGEQDLLRISEITEEYTFGLSDIPVKSKETSIFIEKLKKLNFKEYVFEINNNNKHILIKEETHRKIRYDIIISKNNDISYTDLFCTHIELLEEYFNVIKEFESKNVDQVVNVEQIVQQGPGLGQNIFSIEYKDIEASTDYYPYLNTDLLFKRYFMSDESILLLTGEPGVGKSKLVSLMFKYILENFADMEKYLNKSTMDFEDERSLNIIYVKNEEILGQDQFWTILNKTDSSIVFLDDADNCLLPRKNGSDVSTQSDIDRNKFINNLLSFTDGVYKNNIKFIITTNRDVKTLDPAALRKGRTFDILNLRNLTPVEALTIWKKNKLNENDFTEKYKDEKTISAAELGSDISNTLKSLSNNVSLDSYCLEENISIYKTTKNIRQKKLGF